MSNYFSLAVKWKGHKKFSPEYGSWELTNVIDEIDDDYANNEEVEDYVIVITWDSQYESTIRSAFELLNKTGQKDYRKRNIKWFRA